MPKAPDSVLLRCEDLGQVPGLHLRIAVLECQAAAAIAVLNGQEPKPSTWKGIVIRPECELVTACRELRTKDVKTALEEMIKSVTKEKIHEG